MFLTFWLFSGLVFRVGGLVFFYQLFHKAVSWNLLGISEAQLILQEGWLFLDCIVAIQCSNSNSFVLSFPSKWVAGWFPTQIRCVPREALITSTVDLCLCPLPRLPTAARGTQPCGATGLLHTLPPTCRGIAPPQVLLELCLAASACLAQALPLA